MNGPPSEGDENVIDIFVLSKRETESPLLTEHLENQGYRVTYFCEGTRLFESLNGGNPNLLICDATTGDEESFDVCRKIKADPDHWMIPVLILTGTSDLGALLKILDCNADNFIAYPCDLPYLLSLIEGMLAVPVEVQSPGQIKTQFKIQHDDRLFVVTADRRKLLEFLLSSFEIAVSKSADVAWAENELLALRRGAKNLEERIAEHTRVISTMNETLQKKEQQITELCREAGEHEEIRANQEALIGQLTDDLGEERAVRATGDDHIRRLLEEREEKEHAHRAETDALNRQIASLAAERDAFNADAERAGRAWQEEKTLREGTERMLSGITEQKEHAEKNLDAITVACEDLKSALAQESNRAQTAEEENQALMMAKAAAEHELGGIIDGLRETVQGQEADLARQNTDLAAGKDRISLLESQLNSLEREKQESESSLRSAAETLTAEYTGLTEKYAAAVSENEEKTRTIQSLQESLSGMTAQKAETEQRLESVSRGLAEARAELEAEELNRTSLAEELENVRAEKEKSEIRARALSAELEEARSSYEQEKDLHRGAAETLQAEIRERDDALRTLQGLHEVVTKDLDAHRDELEQLKHGLDSAAKTNQNLDEELATAAAKIRDLEKELDEASAGRTQSEQQAQSLAGELERVTTALGAEQRLHGITAENLKTSLQEKGQCERERDAIAGERDQVKEALATGQSLRETAEGQLRAAALENERLLSRLSTAETTLLQQQGEHAVEAGKLRADLESAGVRLQALELQVHTVTREKVEAEQRAAALSAEIDQARAALAGERDQAKEALATGQSLRETAEGQLRAAALENERLLSRLSTAETTLLQQQGEHAMEAGKLRADLESAGVRLQALERQVHTLTWDKIQAEQRTAALSAEIDQVRTSRADKGESHTPAYERVGFTGPIAQKKEPWSAAPPEPESPGQKERKRSLVIKEPNLPVEARPVSFALANCPHTPEPEPVFSSLTSVEDLFEDEVPEPETPGGTAYVPGDNTPAALTIREEVPATIPADAGDEVGEEPEEDQVFPDEAAGTEEEIDDSGATPALSDTAGSPGSISFNRQQWLDIVKWSHHAGVLSHEQRLQIVRMGRLIQKDRKLTRRQEEQVNEMIALVQTLGYRFT